MRILINLLLFQTAWLACVLGAGQDNFWVGPVAVLVSVFVHLAKSSNKRGELFIIGATGAIGFIVETLLIALEIFLPARFVIPPPWCPLWLFCMWPNFATLLNVSLRWLHGRYMLSIGLGATGGALAYYGGMQLGALTFHGPVLQKVLMVGVAWGIVTPTLLWIATTTNKVLTKKGLGEPAN